jgi:hypothetical protein
LPRNCQITLTWFVTRELIDNPKAHHGFRHRWHDGRMSMINEQPGDVRAASEFELHLTAHGDDAVRLVRTLRTWLELEDELRGRLELRNKPILPGQMGGVVDVLAVTLGTGGAGAVLAASLSTWLTQRRADVTVIVKAPDGREVSVDVRRARDPEAVIREVGALLNAVED